MRWGRTVGGNAPITSCRYEPRIRLLFLVVALVCLVDRLFLVAEIVGLIVQIQLVLLHEEGIVQIVGFHALTDRSVDIVLVVLDLRTGRAAAVDRGLVIVAQGREIDLLSLVVQSRI